MTNTVTAPADTTLARRVIRDAGEYTLLGASGEQFVARRTGTGEWLLRRTDITTVHGAKHSTYPTLRAAAEFVGTWYGRG